MLVELRVEKAEQLRGFARKAEVQGTANPLPEREVPSQIPSKGMGGWEKEALNSPGTVTRQDKKENEWKDHEIIEAELRSYSARFIALVEEKRS